MGKTINFKDTYPSAITLFSKWAEIGKDEGMEKGHAKSVNFMFDKLKPFLQTPFSVLDVGCGVGNLVWGFVNFGIAAEGIDISENAINRSSIEIRSLLKVGDIVNLDYPDNRFNLVNCSDTLEHIPEEVSCDIIRNLYRITNRWLVLNICLWTEKNARLDPTHINLHSKRWWIKKINQLGFVVIKTPDDFPSKRNAFIIKKGA